MTARNARGLGIVALLLAVATVLAPVELELSLISTTAVSTGHLIPRGIASVGLSLVVWAGRALFVLAAYGFARLAPSSTPRHLFVAALLVTVAGIALGYSVPSPTDVSAVATVALSGLGQLLLCIGLAYSGWIPLWIPWLGAVAVAVQSGAWLYQVSPAPTAALEMVSRTEGLGSLAYLAFLVSLGVALILRSRAVSPDAADAEEGPA